MKLQEVFRPRLSNIQLNIVNKLKNGHLIRIYGERSWIVKRKINNEKVSYYRVMPVQLKIFSRLLSLNIVEPVDINGVIYHLTPTYL